MISKHNIFSTITSIGDKILDKLEAKQLYYSHRWRTATFPYISGDSFLSLAGYAALRGYPRIIKRQSLIHPSLRYVLFSELSLEPNDLLTFINTHKTKVFVHHNSDLPPSREIRNLLFRNNVKLMSVNLLDPLPNEECIPLGIENLSYRRNSPMEEYSATPPFIKKQSLYHISVRTNTNDPIRHDFLNQLQSINLTNNQLNRCGYYDRIRTSYFTLCPPGNGLDTHRFWEAIYKESVPVTLTENYLFPKLKLPALQLKGNWTSLSSYDTSQLLDVYHRLRQVDSSMAYMPFWSSRLLQYLE